MTLQDMTAALEAVLYVTGDPLSQEEIARALDITPMELEPVLDALERHFESGGLRLLKMDDKVQIATRQEYAPVIERLLQPVGRKTSLSQSVLETLAVVAYYQPVTRQEIEAVRGVQCDYSVSVLLERKLIVDVGRKDVIGRPILYGTTDLFLRHFGLEMLSDLPQREQMVAAIRTKTQEQEDV